jgi:cell wall assembly regulator SMI1
VIELRHERPPASPEELAAAEAELARFGQHLPPSYRAFLAQHDGGRPVRDRFYYEQDNQRRGTILDNFLGVRPVPSPGTNLLDTAELLWSRIPEGVLPVADDPGGNLVCIDGRDGGDGPVLLWDHEYETEGEPDDANLYYVAPDFQTFLDGLFENPDPLPPLPEPKGLKRLFRR